MVYALACQIGAINCSRCSISSHIFFLYSRDCLVLFFLFTISRQYGHDQSSCISVHLQYMNLLTKGSIYVCNKMKLTILSITITNCQQHKHTTLNGEEKSSSICLLESRRGFRSHPKILALTWLIVCSTHAGFKFTCFQRALWPIIVQFHAHGI